mmetsp:Transcript_79353/g.92749  ORF Transcript_79353/g.92749 Transcript_79353/m.92749 type:complete len:169 (+) Transcript_79353:56-562(+)
MNSKSYSIALLQKQMKEINNSPDSQFSVGLENDNIFTWNVCFEGPAGTLYEGGIFNCLLTFPDNFPELPPKMVFKTEMWHPNIYPDGTVCISILHPPGEDEFNKQELASERWRPVLGVDSILLSVLSMLSAPNIDSPANVDAGIQFRDDPEGYKKKVRALTKKSVEML